MNQSKQFLKVDKDLFKRLTSLNMKEKQEAERELKLVNRVRYSNSFTYFKTNKHNGKTLFNCFILGAGEILTTYNELAKLWTCTYRQARYQIEKWTKQGLILTKVVQDKAKKDLGFILNYMPFSMFKKIGTPKTTELKGKKKDLKTVLAPHKIRGFISKDINKKTNKKDFISSSFSFEKDSEFSDIAQKLVGLKISKKQINLMYQNHSIGDMRDHLELLDIQINKGKVKNPRAYFIASIRDSFDLAQVFVHRAMKQRQEELVKVEIKRQKQEREFRLKQEKENKKQSEIEETQVNYWIQSHQSEFKELIRLVSKGFMFKGKDVTIESFTNPSKMIDFVFHEMVKKKILENQLVTV